MQKLNFYNEVLIRKEQKAFIPVVDLSVKTHKNIVLALVADLSQLGYILDLKAINNLFLLNEREIKNVHEVLVKSVKDLIGANVKYKPLYKNFPNDIPDNKMFFDSFEKEFLYFLQYIGVDLGIDLDKHFDSGLKREELNEFTKYKILGLGTEKDIENIFVSLLSSKTPLSDFDKEIIQKFIELNGSLFLDLIPNEIPVKETLALIVKEILVYTDRPEKYIQIKTATDVLRIAIALSKGDVSLKENTEFKSFSNKERRMFMSILENLNEENIQSDMYRHMGKWLKLGERIHPGAYENKFPKTFSSFNMLRNYPEQILTTGRLVSRAMKTNDLVSLFTLLRNKPGEFVRNFDKMLRMSGNSDFNKKCVLNGFGKIVNDIEIKHLIQLKKYIEGRGENSLASKEFRYFIPKGSIAKMQVIKNNLLPLNEELVYQISLIIEEAVLNKIRNTKTPMKNVYIDPRLKSYLVPLSLRATNKAINVVTRGSQIDFSIHKTLRMFAYWKEKENTVDLDLSAVAFNDNWDYISHLSFTNSKSLGDSVHSGDVRSAPRGASEFIDIDMPSFNKNGVRYVVMSVYSFSGQPFSEFTAHAGFMERENPGSGETYEPKTVVNKFDIYGNGTVAIPMIFDLKEQKLIWTDILVTNTNLINCVEDTSSKLILMGKAISDFIHTKPNLYELFELHAKAFNAEIDIVFNNEKDYDYVFSVDKINEKTVQPNMLNEITSKWL